MLIKLLLDGSLRPEHHNLKSNIAVWIMQEQLPLNHPQNASSLANALGFGKTATVNVSTYTFVTGTNNHLDIRRSAKDLGVSPGQQLILCYQPHVAGSSPQQGASDTPRSQFSQSSPPLSPRGDDRVRLTSMSPTTSRRFGAGDDDDGENHGDGEDSEDQQTEEYHSKDCGWMPFVMKTRQGRPVVHLMDPFQPIAETDRTPPMQELCEHCAALVAEADSLRVVVDRHYRPTIANQEIVEGWVEKLGGSTFPRWQRRYITITEKSVDWFVDKPEPGEKKKITGHRLMVRDGQVLLNIISENPDHPKCKDEGMFHFSITFKDGVQGDKDLLFRVTSAKERSIYVNFLRLCESRMRSPANRNPVFWKRWADAFLTSASDVGALHASNLEAYKKFEREIETLENKLARLRAQRPQVDEQVAEQAAHVQALLKDLGEKEHRMFKAKRAIAEAEGQVEKEQRLLEQKQQELGDELKKFQMLEQHTMDRRTQLKAKIVNLKRDVASIRDRHSEVFAKWRRSEERPATPLVKPSVLLATQQQPQQQRESSAASVAAAITSSQPRLALLGSSPVPNRSKSPTNNAGKDRDGSGATPSGWSRRDVSPSGSTSMRPAYAAGSGGVSPYRQHTAAEHSGSHRLSFSPNAFLSDGGTNDNSQLSSSRRRSPNRREISPLRVDLTAAVAAARLAFSANRRVGGVGGVSKQL